jgi:hypothetical protein
MHTTLVLVAAVSTLWFAACSESPMQTTPVAQSGAGGVGASAGASGSSTSAAAGSGAGTNSVAVAGTRAVAGTGAPTKPAGAGGTSSAGVSGTSSSAGMTAAVGGAGGGAGTASAGVSGGAAGATGVAPGPSFPSVTDLGADGPYPAMTVQRTGPNGTYTVYRPTQLAPGGAKHPIVGWMSGGSTTPTAYPMLPHLATHGFVVVASNTAPSLGEEEALGKEIIAGIDWALAENANASSPFFEKLDATKIASMGYSMGALATTTIAGDPRLTTTVHISGGNMVTERIKMAHAPAAFICGASGVDIAGANCATDFEAATVPVFYGVFNGGDHLGVLTSPYSARIEVVVTGWLRWQLMSDASLKPMFVGDQCTVCKDMNWTVKQKGLM